MSMDRTRYAVQRMMDALGCPAYEIGIKTDRIENRSVAAGKVLNLIPLLRYQNTVREAHIYIRPLGDDNRSFTLLDDLDPAAVDRLHTEGFTPSALVETSPGNFQAWLKHSQPLEGGLATLAARILADRFDADPSAAGWMRYGRLPGFTNRKPAYQGEDGNYPFVLLRSSHSEPFPLATMFHMEITKHLELLDEQQALAREEMRQRLSHVRGREVRKRPLSHYRNLPKYHDDPKSADIAFCVFNLARGISEAELAADLESHYLSRNPDVPRRKAYIERTLRKAAAYVAG
jgi:hypothetical protein